MLLSNIFIEFWEGNIWHFFDCCQKVMHEGNKLTKTIFFKRVIGFFRENITKHQKSAIWIIFVKSFEDYYHIFLDGIDSRRRKYTINDDLEKVMHKCGKNREWFLWIATIHKNMIMNYDKPSENALSVKIKLSIGFLNWRF